VFRTRFFKPSRAIFAFLSAGCIAAAAWYFAIALSFRIPVDAPQLQWELNFDRAATLFSAGFAVAMSSASNDRQLSLSRHIGVYVFIVLGTAGLIAGLALSWPFLPCMLLGLSLGFAGSHLSTRLFYKSPVNIFFLAVFLYLVFFTSVVTYLAALGFTDGLGVVAMWLLVDVSRVDTDGYAAIAVVSFVAIWLLLSRAKEFPSFILSGLSMGLLGPLMFIGYLALLTVKRLGLGANQRMFLSGILGGSIVMLISAANTLMLGGYAPALIVPLGFVSIPVLLWLSRFSVKSSLTSLSERLLISLVVLISVAIIWHLTGFAHQLA